MKNIIQKLAGLSLVVLFAAAVRPAEAADLKIAVVDLQKVFNGYYKTERLSKVLKQEAADMQKDVSDMEETGKKLESDFQKLLDKSEDQSLSALEREKAKKAAGEKLREAKGADEQLQSFKRASAAKLHEKERQRHDDIVKEIRGVLDGEAKAAGYSLVLDTSGDSANTVPVVIFWNGLPNLTDSLIKELNAGAPPAAADDKSAGSKTGK